MHLVIVFEAVPTRNSISKDNASYSREMHTLVMNLTVLESDRAIDTTGKH